MTRVVLSGKTGRSGTVITATGSPAQIRALKGGPPPSYAVRRIVMRHQHNAAEETARETQQRVRDKTPKRSGRTAFSVKWAVHRVGDVVFGVVKSDHENIDRLEEGTGIHGPKRRPIRARGGGVMKFPVRPTGFRLSDAIRQVGGIDDARARFAFARTVKGQPAHHMFRRTATEMRTRAPIIFRKHAKLAAMEIKARL